MSKIAYAIAAVGLMACAIWQYPTANKIGSLILYTWCLLGGVVALIKLFFPHD